jgi:hypothetical protein
MGTIRDVDSPMNCVSKFVMGICRLRIGSPGGGRDSCVRIQSSVGFFAQHRRSSPVQSRPTSIDPF